MWHRYASGLKNAASRNIVSNSDCGPLINGTYSPGSIITSTVAQRRAATAPGTAPGTAAPHPGTLHHAAAYQHTMPANPAARRLPPPRRAESAAPQYGLIECGVNSALRPVSFSTSFRSGPTAFANISLYAPQK